MVVCLPSGGAVNMMLRVCVCVVLLCGLAAATEDKDWWDTGVSVVQRSLQECEAAKDVASCLKVKAVRAMDRALHAGPLPLVNGVVLVKREEPRSARALPALPRDAGRRSAQLDDLLLGRISRFLETRSLQFSLPSLAEGIGRAFEDEARGKGKLKKMAGPAILIMVMAAYKLAMMMAGVAMLSGKALIVSKVALTLAGVAVLKKLLSHGENEKTTVEIVKTPQVSHSHSYSSAHEHGGDDHGYHEKSWNVGPMQGYSHRSLTPAMMDEGVEAMQPAMMVPQDIASKRDYRSVPPPFNNGRGVETLSIHSSDPLRIVVADNGDDDIRVHHRQRQLDLPILGSPAMAAEEPIDYSQFGEADRGAWRGLGSALAVSDRSLRSAPSSEQQERALDGAVAEESSYHPRSLGSSSAPAA